jgi:hypothetical protein
VRVRRRVWRGFPQEPNRDIADASAELVGDLDAEASNKEWEMDGRTIRDVAAAVAAGAAVLLLGDLSLGWYSVTVSAGGVVKVDATSSGWTNIGVVAGLLAIAMLVYMIRPMRRAGRIDLVQAAATAALGVAVFGFTVAAAFRGTASITTPATAVEVGSRLWPAYAGIALSAIVAAATLTALVEVLRGFTAPSRAITAAS